MTFTDLKGRKRSIKSPNKYRIDWDAESLSKFQKGVKDFLRPYWKNDCVFEELPMVGTRCRFDLYNATKRIILETHGKQHTEYNKHFHGGNRLNFLSQIKRDLSKQQFCELNNLTFVEIHPKDQLSVQFFADWGVLL